MAICIITCVFSACSNGESTNDNHSNRLSKIVLTEDMTFDEIYLSLWLYAENCTFIYKNKTDSSTYFLDRSGSLNIATSGSDKFVSAYFFENGLAYSLYVETSEDSDEEFYFYNAIKPDYDYIDDSDDGDIHILFDTLYEVGSEMNSYDFEVKDGKLILSEIASSDTYIFYNFNCTSLEVEKYFPDYKELKVGEVKTNITEW